MQVEESHLINHYYIFTLKINDYIIPSYHLSMVSNNYYYCSLLWLSFPFLSVIAKRIMESRPGLAREENQKHVTPVQLAILWDKVEVLRLLLQHDPSLGYVASKKSRTLLVNAAYRGHVRAARELLNHCPDTPYCTVNGWTCLHEAVCNGQMEFVEFVLGSEQLRKLVNMRDIEGRTPLHHAVMKCNPRMVAALLSHEGIDITMFANNGRSATWELSDATDHAKTLNWVSISAPYVAKTPMIPSIYFGYLNSFKFISSYKLLHQCNSPAYYTYRQLSCITLREFLQ